MGCHYTTLTTYKLKRPTSCSKTITTYPLYFVPSLFSLFPLFQRLPFRNLRSMLLNTFTFYNQGAMCIDMHPINSLNHKDTIELHDVNSTF